MEEQIKKEPTEVEFSGKVYTKDRLNIMNIETLLSLRNTVAECLLDERLKEFKDQTEARTQTWAILVKFSETPDDKLASSDPAPLKKRKQSKKVYDPSKVKGARGLTISTISARMTKKIKKIKTPDRCAMRWNNYKDGMTILEVMEGSDMTHTDINFFVRQGFMKLEESTEEEIKAMYEEFHARKGTPNPLAKEAERAEAKRAKEAEKARKAEAKKAKLEEAKKAKEAA